MSWDGVESNVLVRNFQEFSGGGVEMGPGDKVCPGPTKADYGHDYDPGFSLETTELNKLLHR